MDYFTDGGDLVHLNVGGRRFSTSRQTLTWIPDTFFTALLSGHTPSLRDETGAIFIDRDPALFSVILNYLRTKNIDIKNSEIRALHHESEYYGITPLMNRLALCEDLNHSYCGDVLFSGSLPTPIMPLNDALNTNETPNGGVNASTSTGISQCTTLVSGSGNSGGLVISTPKLLEACLPSTSAGLMTVNASLGSMVRVFETESTSNRHSSSHSRNSSSHLRCGETNDTLGDDVRPGFSAGPSAYFHTASLDFVRHSRNSSADLNDLICNDVGLVEIVFSAAGYCNILQLVAAIWYPLDVSFGTDLSNAGGSLQW